MKERLEKCKNCIFYDICNKKYTNCEHFYNKNTENYKEINDYYSVLKENIEIYNEICEEFK